MSKPVPMKLMPIIAVQSVDEIRNFYVETLGFDHKMGVVGKDGQFDFVTIVKDGASIMFARAPETTGKTAAATKQPVEIYLEVDDVETYHSALKKKKVRITDPLTTQWWGDRTFKILDLNGDELWFFEQVGEPKPPQGIKIISPP